MINIKNPENMFKPSDFMKGRRPELFSDSLYSQKTKLNKELFEYYLETLTSRKQEYEFERFCILLAQKEICPNLIPQTGPTGGGDSKVDTETYPVADDISAQWYEGIGRESSQERWAFAISAKKEWLGKIKSDVKKIAESNRNYKLAYFISSCFIRDKKRAEIEDKLSNGYNLRVKILDRTWIVEKVIQNGRENIAIEALGLSPDFEKVKILGSLDAERERELKIIDDKIQNYSNSMTKYNLVEEIRYSAKLARELERSQIEVHGRFDRAILLAEEIDYNPLKIRVYYDKAWTAFWWFNDVNTLDKIYDKVEPLVLKSIESDELEFISNLITVMFNAVKNELLDKDKFDERAIRFKSKLDELINDLSRPNNSLHARSLLACFELLNAVNDSILIEKAFNEIYTIMIESEKLRGFPIIILTKIVTELSNFLPDLPIIDQVYNKALQIANEHLANREAGTLLLQRVYFKYSHSKPYEALELVEHAHDKFSSDEFRVEQIKVLLITCSIYESIGLLWAARGSAILAVDIAFGKINESLNCKDLAIKALNKLIWLEIQNGRILQTISWHKLILCFFNRFGNPEVDLQENSDEIRLQDLIIGILLLKTEIIDLKMIEFLLTILEEQGLIHSYYALLYALGYEEDVLKELSSICKNKEELLEFFNNWLDQPAAKQIPDNPSFYKNGKGNINSCILGTNFIIKFDHSSSSLNFSETFIASLEAFWARWLSSNIFPHKKEYIIEVLVNNELSGLPKYDFCEPDSITSLIIQVPKVFTFGPAIERQKYRKWLIEIMLIISVRILNFPEGEKGLSDILMQKKASHDFSIALSDLIITSTEDSHSKEKLWLEDYRNPSDSKFSLKRLSLWYSSTKRSSFKNKPNFEPNNIDSKDFFSTSTLKHSQVTVESLINQELWDEAGWNGAGYIWKTSEKPLILLLLFSKNRESASKIFEELLRKIGKDDKKELLRISIIRGINKQNPSHYRIVISSNFENIIEYQKRLIVISRVHTMEPETSYNLENFINMYNILGHYFIAPAYSVDPAMGQVELEFINKYAIHKTSINLRWAWEIKRNDPDNCGIRPDDDPIIPKGEINPPILETLDYIRKNNLL